MSDASTLPHYLRPGLRLVFIGYNPSVYSAEAGHYYARAGNVFWRQLNASGLLPHPAGPEDDASLMDAAGVGFVDLCPRPTVRADELTEEEIAAGARRLHAQLLEVQPRWAVFSGRGIYVHFGRHALGLPRADLTRRPNGAQTERIGATVPWVVPSSSGLASRWHGERLELLRELAALAPPPAPTAPAPPRTRS